MAYLFICLFIFYFADQDFALEVTQAFFNFGIMKKSKLMPQLHVL